MRIKLFYTIICFLAIKTALSQATVNAGNDFTMCPGSTAVLGGTPTATGGTPPYTYLWQPTTGLSSASLANPNVSITNSSSYVVTVTDNLNRSASDTVQVTVDSTIMQYTPGPDVKTCFGGTVGVQIGATTNTNAPGNILFIWQPSGDLSSGTSPNPIANPTTSTVYTLTVSDGTCTASTGTVLVGVTFFNLLTVHDTTILEGTTITLNASGAQTYTWIPLSLIKYDHTPTPDVWPYVTTTYTVYGQDAKGCFGVDTIRVRVLPSDDLVFYSAFTPNKDGDNDYFYIGNIGKYPDNIFKVYNRYGQVVFTATSYQNDWDGSYQGKELPTGTYFYILDTGTDKGKYKGTVTILR
jgi:gliding motility-associated-like protein